MRKIFAVLFVFIIALSFQRVVTIHAEDMKEEAMGMGEKMGQEMANNTMNEMNAMMDEGMKDEGMMKEEATETKEDEANEMKAAGQEHKGAY